MVDSKLIERIEEASGPDRRILDRLDRTSSCWLWTGALDASGRGRVWRHGKLMIHHRAVWEILVGPIPAGALLCHHCDNPTCANPAHLYVGTSKSNVGDMIARKRHWVQRDKARAHAIGSRLGKSNNWMKGEKNPKAKLSAQQVEHIRRTKGPSRILAERYGVHPTTVQRIRRGAQWPAAALRSRSSS